MEPIPHISVDADLKDNEKQIVPRMHLKDHGTEGPETASPRGESPAKNDLQESMSTSPTVHPSPVDSDHTGDSPTSPEKFKQELISAARDSTNP